MINEIHIFNDIIHSTKFKETYPELHELWKYHVNRKKILKVYYEEMRLLLIPVELVLLLITLVVICIYYLKKLNRNDKLFNEKFTAILLVIVFSCIAYYLLHGTNLFYYKKAKVKVEEEIDSLDYFNLKKNISEEFYKDLDNNEKKLSYMKILIGEVHEYDKKLIKNPL
jgi:uncharacterized membrane protein YjgN (DUF898 family)